MDSTIKLFFVILAGLSFVILNMILACLVYDDAKRMQRTGDGLFLGGPVLWAFATLCGGGLTTVAIYWVVHYSTLRPRMPVREDEN